MSLKEFNFDTKYGVRTLRDIYRVFQNNASMTISAEIPVLTEEHIEFQQDVIDYMVGYPNLSRSLKLRTDETSIVSLKPHQITFPIFAAVNLHKVDINVFKIEDTSVSRFLNRILGLETEIQNLLFQVTSLFLLLYLNLFLHVHTIIYLASLLFRFWVTWSNKNHITLWHSVEDYWFF